MDQPRIAFVSREVYPFAAAGLGNYVTFAAAALAGVAEVTVITTSLHQQRYHELRSASDRRLPNGVRFEFVREPEPEEAGRWYGELHLWSARAYDALRRLYPDGGPDLVEFPDYLGEACVTTQAARSFDPALRNTTVCVRCYTTMEICAVLDGYLDSSRTGRLMYDLERQALRDADFVLAPGGDVAASYRRYYGDAMAPVIDVPHCVTRSVSPERPPDLDGELRLLYVGRLERRKGVQNLVRAATATLGTDWSMTLVGGDTPTAPLGLSLRDQLELMATGDERVRLIGRLDREDLRELIADSHVLVSPSLWECWPNTVLEAFEQNRPVLATPVGGHLGMVEPGGSGWLFDGTDTDRLAAGLERLIDNPEAVQAAIESGAPRGAFDRLTDPEPVRERYLELCDGRRSGGRSAARRSDTSRLVSVIVPYFRMHDHVAETVESIFAQTHRPLEVIVVNDGSFEPADYVLVELSERFPIKVVTQPNSGLGAARNLGVAVSRGRYIVPVDPDDVLEPDFIARCVEVLEAEPELPYVTTWTSYVDEDGSPIQDAGYRPLGNSAGYLDTENVAGSAMALMRRSVFAAGHRFSSDLTSYEDWLLYRQLAAAGLCGRVIPEPLARYRVRRKSMMRTIAQPRLERLHGELMAHLRESEVEWTSSSA